MAVDRPERTDKVSSLNDSYRQKPSFDHWAKANNHRRLEALRPEAAS